MLHSLRSRLALSHTLPILIVVPLLGVILLYQLERTYFLDNLAEDLAVQGALIAQFTKDNQTLWSTPQAARLLLQRVQEHSQANVMLLDRQAHLLSSTLADEQGQTGQAIDAPFVQRAANGQTLWTVDYNANGEERAVDVVIPVLNDHNSLQGFVRLSQRLTDLQQRLNEQRWLVLVTLFAGAGISLVLGLLLARSLGAPLLRLTDAVAHFSPEKPPVPLPETGPNELKTLAATYNQQSRHLYELERTRKILLSGIVHELGRPLGSIKTAAQAIQQSNDPTLTGELATGINDQVDHLRLHLDDLALLGELELQGLTLARESVDLLTLIEGQCRQFAWLAQNQGLSLTCQLPPSLPVIQADPKRVSQILGNLMHNACKYTPAGGQIWVAAQRESTSGKADTILICVGDNGPSILPEEQERIFQLFYRSPGQRRIHEGMGIGLALARQLAEAHNGSLTVESQTGWGATFQLRLPVSV